MPLRTNRIVVALTLVLALTAGPRADEVSDAEAEEPRRGEQRQVIRPGPSGAALEIAAGPGSILGKDELILKEYVDIKFGGSRLQADFVRFIPSTNEAHAEGNVILDQGSTRITAESLDYNLETETGIFYKASGYAEPSYSFEAERIEKTGENELVLHDASFTACTQPIPYWSFKVGRALLKLNEYAYLHNLSFKVGRATIFYSPYLIWPIKTDRATGLLFPQFGFSRRGGTVISNAVYWAMRRNMDSTLYLDYFSKAGYGTGLEYRLVPNERGRVLFTGYHIRDQVVKEENRPDVPVSRWVIDYQQTQDFGTGWRMVANANFISDFDYYLDYERDFRLSSTADTKSNILLTRNWGFHSLNIRGERHEQVFNERTTAQAIGDPFLSFEEDVVVRWSRPEVELRSSRQRLGRSPFYLALESSAASFSKGTPDADYERLHVLPTISTQLSRVTWLDVNASVGLKNTYYTRSQDSDLGCDNQPRTGDSGEGNGNISDGESDDGDGIFTALDDTGCDAMDGRPIFGAGNGRVDQEREVIFDESINLNVLRAGLEIIGPKMSRVFDTPDSDFSPQYKHTFEPTLRYTYQSDDPDANNVIRFDEIDAFGGEANQVTYSLISRLFAKRPAAGSDRFGGAGAWGATYVGAADPRQTLLEAMRGEDPEEESLITRPLQEEQEKEEKLSTVEVATFELSQVYSFLGPISRSEALDQEKRVSPIRAALRLNPSIHASIDLKTDFDVIFRDFRQASLGAHLRSPRRGFLDLTWSLVRDLEGKALLQQGKIPFSSQVFDRNQIVVEAETSFFRQKMLLGVQASYELGDVPLGEPRLRDQRYKFGYNTQCCGFQLEFLDRDFRDAGQREIRFLINLRGVGNVIDLNSRSGSGF
jgi:lipopolysaccharide assembly outer membrane protein LptD (OstA)